MKQTTGAALMLLLLALPGAVLAQSGPTIYVTPTVGLWHWDGELGGNVKLEDHSGLVLGGRVGFSPIEAFSGEIVVLTGTNTAVIAGSGSSPKTLRLTTAEFSFLVNFQSITSARIYPFLDLGVGGIMRSGDVHFDDSRFAFHLGGGLKSDLSPRWGLRFNVRDTFFSDTQRMAGAPDDQVTVDSLELSLGLEYRLPVHTRHTRTRLR